MEIDWGTPVLRKKKEERFSTPVVTMSALAGKGSGRKFSFNKAAQDALGLVKLDEENGQVSYVSFGRANNDIFVIASETEQDGMKMFKTNKSFSFSDKKTYEFLTRTLGLSNVAENHLHLEQVEGEAFFKVVSVDSDSTPSEEEGKEEETTNATTDTATATVEVEEEVAEAPGETVGADEESEWD